jgi:hypothetical protein
VTYSYLRKQKRYKKLKIKRILYYLFSIEEEKRLSIITKINKTWLTWCINFIRCLFETAAVSEMIQPPLRSRTNKRPITALLLPPAKPQEAQVIVEDS